VQMCFCGKIKENLIKNWSESDGGWLIGEGNGNNGAQLWGLHEMGTTDHIVGYINMQSN
jgi:hypothetical protein